MNCVVYFNERFGFRTLGGYLLNNFYPSTKLLLFWSMWWVGRCGYNVSHGQNTSHFCPSCVYMVFFCVSLHIFITFGWSVKEFSFIYYLVFIINPQHVLSAVLFCICFFSLIAIAMSISWRSTKIGGDDIHKEESGNMMIMLNHAEERVDRWHDICYGPQGGEGWHDDRG